MINEDKKESIYVIAMSVSDVAIRNNLTLTPHSTLSHKGRGKNKKLTCHAELVSASHTKIDSQHKEEIPEQVRNDMNKQQTLSRICKLMMT